MLSVWYFHVRLKNAKGWGATSHFKFQIDTTKPESFDIKQIDGKLSSTKAKFTFTAKDISSGIDHYEIQIDDSAVETWKDSGNNTYETPILNPGKHTLLVKAVDAAGNFLEKSTEFTIEGLEPPTITEYSKELQRGEVLVVKGQTYPNFDVLVWIQKGKSKAKSYSVNSDDDGKFIFTKEMSSGGSYNVWAEVQNQYGQKSGISNKVSVNVKLGTIFSWMINLPFIVIPFLILILLASYFGYKYFIFKKKLKREIFEAKAALHRSFEFIRKDIKREFKLFEAVKTKKELLREMDKISQQLKKDLDNAEKIVKKEIDDIEKEVK